jgi:soluble lytic murein transglycosylase-like protein
MSILPLEPLYANTNSKVFGLPIDQCIAGAAKYHRVDPQLLKAILMVESRLNPKAMNRNTNGTRDIGVAQVNTIHLPILEKHGINETSLQDGCINTYVGAWLLSKQIARHGLNWFGVAAYHSTTPSKNAQYQYLIYKELVRTGQLEKTAMATPPLLK